MLAENPTHSSHENHGGNLLSPTGPLELGINSEADRKGDRQDAEFRPLGHPRNHQRERSCYSNAERDFRVEKRVFVMVEEDDEWCQQQQQERNCGEDERPSAGRVRLVLGGQWH